MLRIPEITWKADMHFDSDDSVAFQVSEQIKKVSFWKKVTEYTAIFIRIKYFLPPLDSVRMFTYN